MRHTTASLLIFVVLCLRLPAQDAAESRTALVFGVGNYAGGYFTRLEAPETDAQAMADKLKALGFEVTLKLNATRKEMLEATDAFGTTLAKRQGVGLFYFSGHGSMKPDEADPNFLIPAGTAISSREDLPQEAFNAQRVANRMKEAGNRLNLIFLDACRSNALPSRSKDAAGGLAAMRGASGLMFFFATQPNQIAIEDSENKRSLFTQALLQHIATPGLSFMDMMADVTEETEKLSAVDGGTFKQSPFMSGTLSGRFSFAPASRAFPPVVSIAPTVEMPRVAHGVANSQSTTASQPSATADLSHGQAPYLPFHQEFLAASGSGDLSVIPMLSRGSKAGDSLTFNLPGGERMTLCCCPSGSFTMGSPESEEDRDDGEKQVTKQISKRFWIAREECTQGQWQALMGTNPSFFQGNKDLPVEQVSWEDVQLYIEKLQQTWKCPPGLKWSLPTDVQWEYACRAGTHTVFAFGNTLTTLQANFHGGAQYGVATRGESLNKTSPIAQYKPNAWGIFDMHGNVWEWCIDFDDSNPPALRWYTSRGGAWNVGGYYCRSAKRNLGELRRLRDRSLGFRVALVPTAE